MVSVAPCRLLSAGGLFYGGKGVAEEMNKLKYAILVLLGGCSYGTLSTIMKVAFQDGYTTQQLIGGQYLFGWLLLLLLTLVFSRVRINAKMALKLVLVGLSMSVTSIFYSKSVTVLPASIAVVALFQFTWIGVLLEAVAERKWPSREKWLSMVLLLTGSFLAGGVFNSTLESLSVACILFGLVAACSFAFYIFVSGRVGTSVPVLNKSLFMVTGAIVLVFAVFSPSILYDGSIPGGLWKYGLVLSLLGIIVPVVFFAIGVPKVGPGLGTILSAAELPAAVVVSVWVLRENVTFLQWIGIIIIFAGIILPQLIQPGTIREKSREKE